MSTTATATPQQTVTANGFRVKCSANNLDKKGMFNKGDPFLLITRQDDKGKNIVVYRSEVAAKTTSPAWAAFELEIATCGGLDTPLTIECFDWSDSGEHESVGSFKVTLREMSMPHAVYPIINPEKKGGMFYKNSGQVTFDRCEPIVIPTMNAKGYTLKFRADDLDSKGALGIGKSNPYFIIKGVPNVIGASVFPTPTDALMPPHGSTVPILIHRSEVVQKDENPIWHQFQFDIDLAGGLDKDIAIEIHHWDDNGITQFIGSCTTTLRQLTFPAPRFVLLNPDKKGNMGYKHSGILHVMSCKQEEKASAIPAVVFDFTVSARDLDRHDVNGKSDPYFIVYGTPHPYVSKPYIPPEAIPPKVVAPAPTPAPTPAPQPVQQPVQQPAQTTTKTKTASPAQTKKGSTKPAQTPAPAPVPAPAPPKPVIPEEPRVPIYRSEIVYKNLNPDFSSFSLNLFVCGGMDSLLEFKCWDYDADGHDDYIGSFKTTLRELMSGAPSFRLVNEKKEGNLLYTNSGLFLFKIKPSAKPTIEEFMDTPLPKEFIMHCRAEKLERKDFLGLGKSDGFLQITGQPYADKKPVVIFKSETVRSNSNPDWKAFKLDVATCGGMDGPLHVEVLDDDDNGKPDFIGSFDTTLRELSLYKPNPQFFLINKAKESGTFYKFSGILIVMQADAIVIPPKEKKEAKKEETKEPAPQVQPQPMLVMQPIPQPYYVPNQSIYQQPQPQQQPGNFTISLSQGPGGFNISLGANTSQIIEPNPYPPQQPYPQQFVQQPYPQQQQPYPQQFVQQPQYVQQPQQQPVPQQQVPQPAQPPANP